MTTTEQLVEALREIAWSNDTKWQQERARTALADCEASKARWKCACGWQGNPDQMTANPCGHLCCPKCGGSGGLVSKPALEQA
jgi:hypothetical protein